MAILLLMLIVAAAVEWQRINNFLTWVLSEHYRLFLLVAILWGVSMCFFDIQFSIDPKDILVEANGMFFDLVIFGVLLAFYDSKKRKEQEIEHEKNIIDDFRGWDEKEAMYRIVGAIKRLNKLNESQIDLSNCSLQMANLQEVKLGAASLENTKLNGADLRGAQLFGAILKGAQLQGANFGMLDRDTYFRKITAKFRKMKITEIASFESEDFEYEFRADLSYADLSGANLSGVDFGLADLRGAKFEGANLSRDLILLKKDKKSGDLKKVLKQTNFLGAFVDHDWFKSLASSNAKEFDWIMDVYQIDENGILIRK